MKRQDLRNRAPKFRGADFTAPLPKARWSLKLTTVLKVVAVLALLALLWETRPSAVFPDCGGTEVPRHCVD